MLAGTQIRTNSAVQRTLNTVKHVFQKLLERGCGGHQGHAKLCRAPMTKGVKRGTRKERSQESGCGPSLFGPLSTIVTYAGFRRSVCFGSELGINLVNSSRASCTSSASKRLQTAHMSGSILHALSGSKKISWYCMVSITLMLCSAAWRVENW